LWAVWAVGAGCDVDADKDGVRVPYGDCDDEDATIGRGLPEVPYDGVDQDCDGADLVDVDGDGVPGGAEGSDCDDESPFVGPGSTDQAGDEIDQNCDGVDGTDQDGDGVASTLSGGDDCDDGDAEVVPGVDLDLDGAPACEDCDDRDAAVSLGDLDGDGYSECEGDCAPTRAWLHPYDADGDGVEEACGYRDVWCAGSQGIVIDSDGYLWNLGEGGWVPRDGGERFLSLGEGSNRPCGVTWEGQGACLNTYGLTAQPPPVPVLAVEWGVSLLPDGTLSFWGESGTAPAGVFTEFAGDVNRGLGVTPSGAVQEWGSSAWSAPSAVYEHVSSDYNDTRCGTTSSGAACWGSTVRSWDNAGVAGQFVAIRNNSSGACALRPNGRLSCWGYAGHIEPLTDDTVRTFMMGVGGLGVVTTSGAAYCTDVGVAP
jgi:hypothetical protein